MSIMWECIVDWGNGRKQSKMLNNKHLKKYYLCWLLFDDENNNNVLGIMGIWEEMIMKI